GGPADRAVTRVARPGARPLRGDRRRGPRAREEPAARRGGCSVVTMLAALVIGFGLGASVAAQLGPISLLAIRSTLRNGWAVGVAIGAGVATIDTLYAAAGAAGAGAVMSIDAVRP